MRVVKLRTRLRRSVASLSLRAFPSEEDGRCLLARGGNPVPTSSVRNRKFRAAGASLRHCACNDRLTILAPTDPNLSMPFVAAPFFRTRTECSLGCWVATARIPTLAAGDPRQSPQLRWTFPRASLLGDAQLRPRHPKATRSFRVAEDARRQGLSAAAPKARSAPVLRTFTPLAPFGTAHFPARLRRLNAASLLDVPLDAPLRLDGGSGNLTRVRCAFAG